MRGLRQIMLHNRALATMLVALALCVRALVPAGYMATGAGRSITITLCADASGAPRQVAVQLGAKHDPGKDSPDKHKPCAFAGMGAALAAPVPLAVAEPAPAAEATSFLAQHVGVGHGLAAPPPHQTGPPLTA